MNVVTLRTRDSGVSGLSGGERENGAGGLVVVLPFAAMRLFLPEMGVRLYPLLTYGPLIGVVAVLVVLLCRRRFNAGAFLLLATAYLDDPVRPDRRLILVSNVREDATGAPHRADGSAG